MHSRKLFPSIATLLLFLGSPLTSPAADVLQNVPHDAFGFVVVKNLAATDSKVLKLLRAVDGPNLGPLMFLQAATGISEGLDPQGDLLLVVLPGATDGSPQFAVWLPVRDYDALIASLGAAPGQQIAGVSVANEEVLIARHGRWAVVMDPDQRNRMEKTLAAETGPPSAAARWNEWIDGNDAAVVALPGGIRAVLAWAAAAKPGTEQGPAPVVEDDIFGFHQPAAADDPFTAAPHGSAAPTGITGTIQAKFRKWTTASPQLTRLLLQAQLVGCAVRLDDDGNLLTVLRVDSAAVQRTIANQQDQIDAPPTLYEGGNFVLNGSGHLPRPLAQIAAGAYVRALIADLKTEEGMALREAKLKQFQSIVERAAADVESVVVLTQPGNKQEGIYTNEFLVVRAASAPAFADNAKDVMRIWNSMNRDAESELRLVFDVEEVKFGARTATQYSVDIAAADGAPALPEIRQAMEQLFGPGGMLRLWIVPVDDHNVLLATATPDQVAEALKVLDRKEPINWQHDEIAAVNKLLPDGATWRAFFSPHHHNAWRRREMHAITGPVLGGPLVKEFPPSPPVGIAGGVRDGELWMEAATPADSIRATIDYLKALRRKPSQ